MQIYVVKPGDTIWQIANMYSIPYTEIIDVNELPNPDNLVVGQALLIPVKNNYHIVQPGESLYSISRKYNVSIPELLRINRISNPSQLQVGLRLNLPKKPKSDIEVSAYIDPRITGDDSAQEIEKVADNLTYLNIFSYAVNRDGTLTPVEDQPSINAAYDKKAVPIMVLTNFEEGTFSQEIATLLFEDEELQDKVLDEAINIMEEKGYLGLDFDFEYLGAENREGYNKFLEKAAKRLKEKDYFISSALAPKISEDQIGTLYEGHDYKAHGEIVDFIYFMTYEWGWSGGPPMAVSPLDQVQKVMEYAISKVPKDKIMMGIPLYGYDWTLPYIRGGQWARAISPQQAIELAAKYGAEIKYDPVAQAPYFNYIDEDGKEHEVWFEDARSIQAKLDLAKQLGIRGVFYWVLGYDFPQNWILIDENFNVMKRV